MVLQMSEMDKKISDAFATPTPEHVEGDVVGIVSGLARAAWNLCDGTANENPPEVDQQDWDRLSAALDRIEALPEVPGVIAGPGAKIEYALQSRIQRAERERDAAIKSANMWKSEHDAEMGDHNRTMARAATAEAQLADAVKVLKPFAAHDWADEHGWNEHACRNDRICDWFGPSDFRAARSFLSTIGEKPDAE